jgi:hypothetical protein
VITSGDVPVPPAFVALIVAVVVLAAIGVPVIAPVLVFTLSGDGSPLAPQLVGEFVAVIW